MLKYNQLCEIINNLYMKINLILFPFLLTSLMSVAQDRYFARAYTSNVLPKGTIDLEFWHTSRFERKDQFYFAQDQRIEFEAGLGHNIQTSLYLNNNHVRFSESKDETITKSELGFSNEWKWKLFDPTVNKVGFALYGEWGLKGGDELELEAKLIFDKIFDKHIYVFNAVYEYEKEFEWKNNQIESEQGSQTTEFIVAYQYLIKPTFGLGFEIQNENAITNDNIWEYSLVSGGPTLNFRQGKWFAIINYLPQWSNLHKTASAPFNKVLDRKENHNVRLVFGVNL